MRYLLLLLPALLHADNLTGRVLEDHSGAPLTSVEVRIAKDGVFELIADLDTNSQGRFDAADLPSGEYRVEFRKPNYLPATARFSTGAPPILVRMVRYGILSGKVLDNADHPVSGARILVTPKNAPLDYRPNMGFPLTDNHGEYRIHDLIPGQYTVGALYSTGASGSGVRFYPDNQHPRVFEITGGEDFHDVDFILSAAPLYSVSGAVEPSGRPYAVALAPVDQPNVPIAIRTTTLVDGVFRFAAIPAGIYDVFAAGPARPYMQSGSLLGDNPSYARASIQIVGQDVEALTLSAQRGPDVLFTLRAAAATKPCAPSAELKLAPLEAWGAIVERTLTLPLGKEQTLTNIAPGRYRISVSKLGDGCYSVTDDLLDLSPGAKLSPIAIEIAPLGAIRGRLTGAQNSAAFTVILAPSSPDPTVATVQFAIPDDKGAFHFDSLRPGHYRVALRPSSETSRTHWISNLATMPEIEVIGGPPTEMTLPAPPTEPRQ